MKGLTKKQKEVLEYIQQYISLSGYSPSYREIMAHFGFRSLASVFRYVHVLKRKEQINFDKQSSRSLQLISQTKESEKELAAEVELPFIGLITGGIPLELFANTQSIAIPRSLVSNLEHTYILRARGDSLNEALISDGDLLIVEGRHNVESGDVVIALINHKETHVKRYYAEGQYIRLDSLSSQNPPLIIPCEEILVQGVVTSLFRLF
jgi:repressor LexA